MKIKYARLGLVHDISYINILEEYIMGINLKLISYQTY